MPPSVTKDTFLLTCPDCNKNFLFHYIVIKGIVIYDSVESIIEPGIKGPEEKTRLITKNEFPTKTIRYGRLVTIEGFQNIRVELEDSFPADMPDIECILSLQKRVLEMIIKSRMFEKERGGRDIPGLFADYRGGI